MLGKGNTSSFGQLPMPFLQQNSAQLIPNSPINTFFVPSQNNTFSKPDASNNLFIQRNDTLVLGSPCNYNPVFIKSHVPYVSDKKFNCITCMDMYQNKSLEELRWEAYQSKEKESIPTFTTKQFPITNNVLEKPALATKPLSGQHFTYAKRSDHKYPTEKPTAAATTPQLFKVPPMTPSTNLPNTNVFQLTTPPKLPVSQTLPVTTHVPEFNPTLVNPSNDQNSITFPSVSGLSQTTRDEFNDTVQNLYQPFPRREFLATIGSQFNMHNRTTDPKAISKILEELKESVNATVTQTPVSTYSLTSYQSQIKQSFFQDVAGRDSAGVLKRSLNLNKQINESFKATSECNENEHASFPKDKEYSARGYNETNQSAVNLLKCLRIPKTVNIINQESNLKSGDPTQVTHTINLNVQEKTQIHQFNCVDIMKNGSALETDNSHCSSGDSNSNLIKLTRSGYYTIPPIEQLNKRVANSDIIDNFTIGNKEYGKIQFLEPVNLSNLDLDEIVDIDYRTVTVYPDDSKKPPVGEGLNVKAEVTIDQIWPRDKNNYAAITDIETIKKGQFIDRLKILTKKQNALFVNYLPDTGSWIFIVDHF